MLRNVLLVLVVVLLILVAVPAVWPSGRPAPEPVRDAVEEVFSILSTQEGRPPAPIDAILGPIRRKAMGDGWYHYGPNPPSWGRVEDLKWYDPAEKTIIDTGRQLRPTERTNFPGELPADWEQNPATEQLRRWLREAGLPIPTATPTPEPR